MTDRTELIEFGGGSGNMGAAGGSSSCMDTPENNVNKAEYYIQQLNSSNAKKVALCLVLGFICYHGLIHLRYGEWIHCFFFLLLKSLMKWKLCHFQYIDI